VKEAIDPYCGATLDTVGQVNGRGYIPEEASAIRVPLLIVKVKESQVRAGKAMVSIVPESK